MSGVGENIQRLRRAAGLTQAALGEEIGVTNTAVSNWEQGLAEPTLQNVLRLCEVLNTTADQLLGVPFGSVGSKAQVFVVSHADEGKFEGQGLRSFFEYRQLGVSEASNGEFGAHVIRAVPGEQLPGEWHSHDLSFQMVYVTKGWVEFEYEGQGAHMLRPGSCVMQPSGIRHRLIRNSDDLELVEITSPASFETTEEKAKA
ncbi:MAG: helix-turn-helix domain-containing protein [Pelagimonas sp.]|jgi:transcriptional regulator with XRE-family HTH domain|nr:helix-turn-helix domain-containing protein [Pelagimonas sp.]